jgi:hypothetical protein
VLLEALADMVDMEAMVVDMVDMVDTEVNNIGNPTNIRCVIYIHMESLRIILHPRRSKAK